MKIVSWNVNGIRAVERKNNLQEFLENTDFDICFFQETKGNKDQFSSFLTENVSYESYYFSAEKKGYAGTGVWISKQFIEKKMKHDSLRFLTGMPNFEDTEGRISQVQFENNSSEKFALLGVYFPNGGKSPEAWIGKIEFYKKFLEYINRLRKNGFTVIWCGDVNCAHNEIDLARPETNKKSIGFLPEERNWVSNCVAQGWIDVFREKFPEKIQYSWWHMLTRARLRNVGWRIDYFFCDSRDFSRVKKIEYLDQQMGSDHCPVFLEIE